jgi:Tat protein translocase TatB subunit
MFEVGFTEIILIFGIALLVLGPARLPKLAADLGRWAGRARAMARQLRTQLEQEVQFDPLANGKPSRPTSGHGTIHAPAPPATDPAPAAVEPSVAPPAVAHVNPDNTPTVPDERQPG